MRKLTSILIIIAFSLTVLAGSDENQKKNQHGEKAVENEKTEKLTVEKIVRKANHMAYYQGQDGKSKVYMKITDKQDRTRERQFVILRKDGKKYENTNYQDQKYFVYFQRPADVREMVFMVHKHAKPEKSDDRWLYLPSLDLVKRIAASDKRTSFAGSDYLYEDVSGRSLQEDTHKLKETTEKYYIVRNKPKQPKMVQFKYYDVYIDKKTFMPMKMEYYDAKDKIYRTIESLETKEIQDFITVTKSKVVDKKRESTTIMEFSDIKYNIDLKDRIFTERYLRRPPREAVRY
jgi:outer membrane lipoprotein-sorting protein